MVNGSILRNLPSISQVDETRQEVTYEYRDSIDQYSIQKGPALRIFEISSGTTTYTEGVDYATIEDSDGRILAIDWSIGGNSPDDGDIFTIDQEYRAIIARYLEAHDEEFEQLDEDIGQTIALHQVENATSDDLDRIGALFGELGNRQGRSDSEYRAFLESIINSFSGRGSRAGLKFAIAAAVSGEPEDVVIDENFEENEYSVRIDNVDTDFITSAVNDLAELADPSGVELVEAIILTDGNTLTADTTDSTVVTTEIGLGGGTLTLDGSSTLG
jgi:hypothetical protein